MSRVGRKYTNSLVNKGKQSDLLVTIIIKIFYCKINVTVVPDNIQSPSQHQVFFGFLAPPPQKFQFTCNSILFFNKVCLKTFQRAGILSLVRILEAIGSDKCLQRNCSCYGYTCCAVVKNCCGIPDITQVLKGRSRLYDIRARFTPKCWSSVEQSYCWFRNHFLLKMFLSF